MLMFLLLYDGHPCDRSPARPTPLSVDYVYLLSWLLLVHIRYIGGQVLTLLYSCRLITLFVYIKLLYCAVSVSFSGSYIHTYILSFHIYIYMRAYIHNILYIIHIYIFHLLCNETPPSSGITDVMRRRLCPHCDLQRCRVYAVMFAHALCVSVWDICGSIY